MKILLANPSCKKPIGNGYEKYFVRAGSRWPHSSIKRKSEKPHYVPFPFFLAYTGALLLENNFEVTAIDGVALDIGENEFLQRVCKIRPDIMLLETTTPTIENDLKLLREIKKNTDPRIVLCGAHATTFAKNLLEQNSEIEYILLGEFEFSALNLLTALREKKEFSNMPGVAYRQEGGICVGEGATLIDPLDKLPYPAWELFPDSSSPDINAYWDGFCQNRPAIQMHASRGCPYRCYFCLWNQVMYGNGRYRTFSPERVADEIEEAIRKFSVREVYFDDDDFTIQRNHVLGICKEIKQRRIKIKWSCMGDAINLDEEELHLMSSSGCIGMKFGVESASPGILNKVGKPLKLERVRQIAGWCAKHGIKTHATFTVGLLGETEETMKENLDFARNLDVDTIQVSICTPFPGTAFFEKAKADSLISYSSWEEFDGKSRELLRYPELSHEKMEKFRQEFFSTWLRERFLKPPWLIRQFKNTFRWMRGAGLIFIAGKIWAELRDELFHKEVC